MSASPSNRLEQHLKSQIEKAKKSLGANKLGLLVAVSGGVDSSVLLNGLCNLADENLSIHVAHIDHSSRPQSESDAKFVADLASKLELRFHLHKLDAAKAEGNLEAWWREQRYEFFEKCRIENSLDLILTAHHQRDQAETFLMRAVSGRIASDAKSIAGLDIERKIFRPLLELPKQVIDEYASIRQVPYVEDATNFDTDRTRNAFRHEVLSFLRERFNPKVDETLAEVAQRFESDENFIDAQVDKVIDSAQCPMDVSFVLSLEQSLRWRVLRRLSAIEIGSSANKVGYDAWQRALAVVAQPGAQADVGKGVVIRHEAGGKFSFESDSSPELNFQTAYLDIPGVLNFANQQQNQAVMAVCEKGASHLLKTQSDSLVFKLKAEVLSADDFRGIEGSFYGSSSCRVAFDAKQLFEHSPQANRQLLVRKKVDGDRIKVWSRGERKVKKLFQEQGVKLTLRDRIPIVQYNDTIIWIPGVARSDSAPVGQDSEEILALSIEADELISGKKL